MTLSPEDLKAAADYVESIKFSGPEPFSGIDAICAAYLAGLKAGREEASGDWHETKDGLRYFQ